MCQKKEEPDRYIVQIQEENQTSWSRLSLGRGVYKEDKLEEARHCAAYQNRQPGQKARIWDDVEKRVVT